MVAKEDPEITSSQDTPNLQFYVEQFPLKKTRTLAPSQQTIKVPFLFNVKDDKFNIEATTCTLSSDLLKNRCRKDC